MFTQQSPQVATALWQGGLSAQSAAAVQNLIGQCRAPLVHRGPVTLDYTSPQMRLITPQILQQYFGGGGGAFPLPEPQTFPSPRRPTDPPEPPWFNPTDFTPTEHRPPSIPDGPTIYNTNNYAAGQAYKAGPYIDIKDNEISLRNRDSALHCVFKFSGGQKVVGSVSFVPKYNETNEEFLKLVILERGDTTEFDLQSMDLEQITVLTGASIEDGYLTFSAKTLYAWKPEESSPYQVETTACEEPPA